MQKNTHILPILSEQNEEVLLKREHMSKGLRSRAIAEMCSRYNMTPEYVSDFENIDPLVVLPVTQRWFDRIYERCSSSRLIVKVNPELCTRYDVSIIGTNTSEEAEQILTYLKAAGRTRMAIYAPHKVNFESVNYVNTFLPNAALYGIAMDETDIYWNPSNLADCYDAFLKNYKKYDAVLCYNTQAAVYFCARAKEDHILIPEDLFIIGRGEIQVAEAIHPSITTISLNETEVGYQIVKLYRYLQRNPYVKNATVLLHSRIIPRESTACFPVQIVPPVSDTSSFLSEKLLGESTYLDIMRIESLLNACNPVDIRLLQGMQKGLSREKLAVQEFITLSTVRYRLKRIFQHAGVENRNELFGLLDKYNIDLEALKNHE